MGEELSESVETGTGTTVTPEEPVMVLDDAAEPVVVLTAMGKVDEPSVPVDETATLEAVSLAGDAVALVSDSTMIPVLMTESVADAEYALSVLKWLERPEFIEEAALDRMLEKPEARDCVTAGSVAVAATPDRSELKDEAKLERAAEASFVIAAVAVAVGLPLAPEITDEEAEETALESSEAAEETTPDRPSPDRPSPVAEAEPVGMTIGRPPVPRIPPVVEALAESSDRVGLRIGPRMGRPPVPRMPPVVEAAVDEATVDCSDAVGLRMGPRIGRPPVPRIPPTDEAAVDEVTADCSDAVGLRMGPRMGRPPVPRKPPTGEEAVDEALTDSSDPVGVMIGRPPVPRMPPVVEAPTDEATVDEARVESSAGPVRVGIGRPPVPRRLPVGETPITPSVKLLMIGLRRPPVPKRPSLDEDPVPLGAVTPSAVAVLDPEMSVPFAVADPSLTVAGEVVDAVPSMMVDRPTVIAPRVDELEASVTLELMSGELGPVGDGSAIGAKPVVPTSGEAEGVEMTSVELAVGETGETGRRPPVAPTDGPGVSTIELEISEELLAKVGSGRRPGISPVEPTAWLARDELRSEALPTLGCTTLFGAEPVGAAKPSTLDEEPPMVGCTTSSGRPPVEPTDSGLVVRRALLKVGSASETSDRRSAELVVVAELEEKVG
jgi:hypothetical protein